MRYEDGAFLRELEASGSRFFVTDLGDDLESREFAAGVAALTRNNHTLELNVTNFYERVSANFMLPGDVLVPVGAYEWTNVRAIVETSRFRSLSVGAEIACCSFYNGDALETVLSAELRPNRFYSITASHEWTGLDLPGGEVDIHVSSLNATVTFTPDMQLALQTQYDNISESIGFLARYRWEFMPGSELLVAFGQAAILPDSGFTAQRSQLTVRLGHTFQF